MRTQTLVGLGVVGISAVLAAGAVFIPATAGYQGVGPNFLPWVVAAVLLVCGVLLVWEARTGGYRSMDAPSGAARADWRAMAWITAGILANAALITRIGFILSCTLCFVLAVRAFRLSMDRPSGGLAGLSRDALLGAVIAAPVYWMFTKLLGISLPGLTASGWI